MTLDDFLRALENLIEDREASDDDPGEGNFSCEDCRACNHCRFCVGCDSCEDCTYCEECIDCTSATQSKRCVGCRKISYCDDSRDCTSSRYLTLCVACTDCVHCLACVGLDGGEFYVLNEKRTRKEYFAVLRQVQELMQGKMNGGWRPPGIGLASEIFDAVAAGRDSELSAAPWLVDPDPEPRDDYPDETPYEPEHDRALGRERARDHSLPGPEGPSAARVSGRWPESGDDEDWAQSRADARERAREHGRDYAPADQDWAPAADRGGDPRRGRGSRHADDPGPHGDASRERPGNDWVREPPEYGSSYSDQGAVDRGRQRERGRARPGHEYGRDLGQDYGQDYEPPGPRGRETQRRMPDTDDGVYDEHHDHGVPHKRDQHPTEPFARRQREPVYHPERGDVAQRPRSSHPTSPQSDYGPSERPWQDSRESGRRRDPGAEWSEPQDDLIGLELPPVPEPLPPRGREREREPAPPSPWLEDNAAQGRRRAKKGSLRRAGRPERPPEASSRREVTGTGTGTGTGSASGRLGSEGTHTGSALRLGRKPKRKRKL